MGNMIQYQCGKSSGAKIANFHISRPYLGAPIAIEAGAEGGPDSPSLSLRVGSCTARTTVKLRALAPAAFVEAFNRLYMSNQL